MIVVEGADVLHKGSDGLFLGRDELLHAFVADEEVGGRDVFVEQEAGGSCFDGFDNVSGLRGGAGSVFAGEGLGVLPSGEVVDERGEVDLDDGAPIFGADLGGVGPGHDELPSVARTVIVDTAFESVEERGLAMVAASDDEGDPGGNAHAGDLSAVGADEGGMKRLGRLEGDRTHHGAIVHAAGPGQDGAVGDEGDEAPFVE